MLNGEICVICGFLLLGADQGAENPGFESLVEKISEQLEKFDKNAQKFTVPDFPADKEWFNSRPLSFEKELKGKLTVLDFWTYCCINCIHVLPDLAYLEKKYAGHPVAFVGVHSAKFTNEKVSENIRRAVLRYEIEHPVVNDDEMLLWRRLGVSGWPSLAVVGPQGQVLYLDSGEGQREVIDAILTAALMFYPAEVFRYEPVPLRLEKDRQSLKDRETQGGSPLRFPGKLAVDPLGKRLFISDSNNHRIVVTDLEGRFIEAIGQGRLGLEDGSYEKARFNRLQGLAYHEGQLYVADAENHALRRVDLTTKQVVTLVGNGEQGRDYRGGGAGREQQLSTPWDVVVHDNKVYIAMAGTHQIWVYDIALGQCANFSGTGAEQNLNAEDRLLAAWAQPSGLTVGAGELFVADSESSTVRAIDLEKGSTRTVVGGVDAEPRNLFAFGDQDGKRDSARLQHPLGVLWLEKMGLEKKGRVLAADTYNHRLKLVDPKEWSVETWVGSGETGHRDGQALEAQFAEPSGFALSPDARTIFVADTNNHAIRTVDLETATVKTLDLGGVPPAVSPVAPRSVRLADLPGTPTVRVDELKITPASDGKLVVRLRLPPGHKFLEGAESRWQIIRDETSPIVVEESRASGRLESGREVVVPFKARSQPTGGPLSGIVRLEALAYFCKAEEACRLSGVVFEVPVTVTEGSVASEVVLEHAFEDMSSKSRALLLPGTK